MSQNKLTTDKPTIVIAGTLKEYYDYCRDNNLDETNSLFVTSPKSLPHYPMDCPLVKTGTYWLNNCEGSRELRERENYLASLP